jgi:sterol desaturase/sphingolipid hydroxylase (fatty acid hydroxylase superfamily)
MIKILQGLPTLDTEAGFRAWWVEPMLASLSFAVFIHMYWYEERKLGLSRDNRLQDTLGVTTTGDLYNSLAAYWMGILILNMFVPKTELPDGVPEDFLGTLYLLCEVVNGIFMYDALFFLAHWLMHEVSWLRQFHVRHHDARKDQLEARDVLQHSLIDGSLQVLCNILVQKWNPWGGNKSRLARALHNVVVTWMLTESHTASPVPFVWRRWCVGVREHRLHHFGSLKGDSYSTYYHRHQQFFGYLDNFRAMLTEKKECMKSKLVLKPRLK